MMKKYYFLIVAFLSFIPLLIAMDKASAALDLGKVKSTIFVTERIVAIGSDRGCFLIFDLARPTERREIIHNIPTLNLFSDKKHRLGVLCADSFAVYDITTKKKLWSQTVYGKDCYAGFSSIDDTIFLYRQGEIVTDINTKTINSTLAVTGENTHLSFTCHPKKPEFAYPCANQSFIIRPFNSTTRPTEYLVKIDESDCIRRILYSPDGSRILLHTNEHKLYLYDLPNKKAIPVSNSENQCYGAYHYPMFLPDTNNVIAFICNEYYAHYCDLRNNEEITSFRLKIEDIPSFSNDNFLTNIFDISCQTSQLITALNTFNAQSSTVGNIKHLMHKYVLFKNFFNDKGYPLEIAKLIANFFYHLYPFRLSDS